MTVTKRKNAGCDDQKHSNDNGNDNNGKMVPAGMLPAYLAEAFGEMYSEDGLCVFGKGLGYLSLMASFIRFYADVEEGHMAVLAEEEKEKRRNENKPDRSTIRKPKKPPLVLVLGLRDAERTALMGILESWGTPPAVLPTMITTESGQGNDRAALYQAGGVFCITSRILIVDLLTSVISCNDIAGILVGRAEQVTVQSTEAFIIRIFQSQKLPIGSGFVKAFTDAPDQVNAGFAKVEKILKALHVRRLYLYPRFHDSIRNELEGAAASPTVTELHQQLSPLQREIQNALAAATKGCIRELKQSTKLLEWTDAELTVENCVTSNFDRAISRQLEHDWHRLRPQTKQLVQDLKTLRTLFQSLIVSDCVSFWKLIISIKTISAASRYPSMWLLTPAADMLFRKAKERVYKIQQPVKQGQVGLLKPILEENPKWKLLQQVLSEIRQEHDKKDFSSVAPVGKLGVGPTNVLIMVRDEKAVEAVKSYLCQGKTRTLTTKWFRFLDQYNDRSRTIADNKGGTSALSEESRLLLEEEGRCRNYLFGKNNGKRRNEPKTQKKQLNEIPNYARKRRRIAAEKGRGQKTGQDLEREAVLEEAVDKTEHDLKDQHIDLLESSADDSDQNKEDEDEDCMFDVSFPSGELRVVIRSYSSIEGDQATLLLQDLQPSYVILYDADVSFVRSVEIYSAVRRGHDAQNASDRIKVYFFLFEASAEEKGFMKSLEREQHAFEQLIHYKKSMPPPALHQGLANTQEMQQAISQRSSGSVGTYMGGSLPLAVDTRSTRHGKGKFNNMSAERRDIAVDVREFRSALPFILHQGGMRLAPVTLIVGDFVLSNVHCVERKSISDLFGSFSSGRLYTQVEAMSKHYKCPCLLIEFDPAKSFCLQNSNELGVEIRSDSVCSKMALLAMHFPKLRILWSRSPHETLRIFRDLKTNHSEVDVDKAVDIGRKESLDAGLLQLDNRPGNDNDEDEDEINESARDMLLRLPGVNVHSARKIMAECDSLAELSSLSRDEMRQIAGPVTGQKLFTFFRQKMAGV